jgi:hypothetical protein
MSIWLFCMLFSVRLVVYVDNSACDAYPMPGPLGMGTTGPCRVVGRAPAPQFAAGRAVGFGYHADGVHYNVKALPRFSETSLNFLVTAYPKSMPSRAASKSA